MVELVWWVEEDREGGDGRRVEEKNVQGVAIVGGGSQELGSSKGKGVGWDMR